MTGQELATAIQYGANPKIVLSDNGSYGTIRTHQERHFPHRVSAPISSIRISRHGRKSFGAAGGHHRARR